MEIQVLGIPTGFCPAAQGCAPGTTLGKMAQNLQPRSGLRLSKREFGNQPRQLRLA